MRARIVFAASAVLMFAAPAFAQLDERERIRRRRTPIVDVFEACKDAVVNISTTQIVQLQTPIGGFDSLFNELFDFPAPQMRRSREVRRTAVGSGFVIHPSGYIVTNAHVVARTAERKVIFSDESEYEAQIVAMATEFDLAVLKIDADRPLPTLVFGRDDDLIIGETVIAIGNPMGLQNTVTAGVISALDRSLEINDKAVYDGLIQTDASINPGNSGGPLLNVLGELIGVNTAIRGDAQNIGFAIPVKRLQETLPELLDIERRYRIIAGMKVAGAYPPRVSRVENGSPADRSGVREGDVLRAVDGAPVTKAVDFSIGLIGKEPGDAVELTIDRQGRTLKAQLTLEAKPKPDGAKLAWDLYGLELQPVDEAVANKLGLPAEQGLVVTRVELGSPAAQIRLAPADILLEIGRHRPATLDDLGLLLETVRPGDKQRIGILRIGNRALYRMTAEMEAR